MEREQDTYISANLAGTLDGLFRERLRRSEQETAYTYYNENSKSWTDLSWADIGQRVGLWQAAFKKTSLIAGDRVAILLRNRPCWVTVDQAALGLGLVVVPLYIEDRPDNIAYVVQDAGAKVLVVQSAHHWQRLVEVAPYALTGVEHVVVVDGDLKDTSSPEGTRLWTRPDWLPDKPLPITERGGNPHQLATIVYTSGTTGKPKGVMLSHHNILSVAEGSGIISKAHSGQRMLSFLPLSHTFERTCGYYAPMMWGMSIAYARSVQTLADDLLKIKPQILVAVPRIFERVYDKIHSQLVNESALKRFIFRLAVNTGWKRFLASQGRGHLGPAQLLWPFLKKKVADKILCKLGGQLEIAVSGGAALPPPVARLFLGLGLNLIQGYGMTESSPVVCANHPDDNDPDSVGPPLMGIQVRIGDNDELQVDSPGVMLGYWNNHKATKEVMTSDGWLRTGDKARIENGKVYITGRIKDILIMSNGEKIPPVDMEDAITLDPLFDNAVIVGEAKPFLGAVVVLNSEQWFSLAKEHQLDPFDKQSLRDNRLQRTLLNKIGSALKGFPGYAKVRRVVATLDPWTVDNGVLTPTLKTKRQIVMKLFADDIERLYAS